MQAYHEGKPLSGLWTPAWSCVPPSLTLALQIIQKINTIISTTFSVHGIHNQNRIISRKRTIHVCKFISLYLQSKRLLMYRSHFNFHQRLINTRHEAQIYAYPKVSAWQYMPCAPVPLCTARSSLIVTTAFLVHCTKPGGPQTTTAISPRAISAVFLMILETCGRPDNR